MKIIIALFVLCQTYIHIHADAVENCLIDECQCTNTARKNYEKILQDVYELTDSVKRVSVACQDKPNPEILTRNKNNNMYSKDNIILDLMGNVFNEIPNDVFSGLNITYLDLSINKISWISEFAFRNTSIMALDLSFNSLNTIDDDIFNIEPFKRRIQFLELSSNHLGHMNIDRLSNTINQLPNLRVLSIESNKLTKIPNFKANNHLEMLNFYGNNINSIPDYAFDRELPLKPLSIDFSGNTINSIGKRAFCSIRNARSPTVEIDYLDLGYFPLSDVDICVFKQLRRIIPRKHISSKEKEYTEYNNVNLYLYSGTLRFSSENLKCSCSISYLAQWFYLIGTCLDNDGNSIDMMEYKCEDPNYKNKYCTENNPIYDCSNRTNVPTTPKIQPSQTPSTINDNRSQKKNEIPFFKLIVFASPYDQESFNMMKKSLKDEN